MRVYQDKSEAGHKQPHRTSADLQKTDLSKKMGTSTKQFGLCFLRVAHTPYPHISVPYKYNTRTTYYKLIWQLPLIVRPFL